MLMGDSEAHTFGRWVKIRRKELDLTQSDLASRVACSVETIRKVEAGTLKPSRQLAELLAAGLQVTPEERPAFVRFARTGATERVSPSASVPVPPRGVDPDAKGRYSNLQAPLTSFIGREHEVAAVHALLADPEVRMVTLSGPPGIGKTRLSLHVAAGAEGFADGVAFVPLSPIKDPALVLPTIATNLGLRERGDRSAMDALKSYLSGKYLLLVLDNFEQVVPAAPLLTELLMWAPGVKLLVSSRAVLHVYGEHTFPVPPLSLAPEEGPLSPEEAARSEAVRLFVTRARASRPGFVLTAENAGYVAQICARLDGLPLAIELAAMRARVLSPREILDRLSHRLDLLTVGAHDLPPRQQTLRGAIDWSHELLDPEEQVVFRRMSVFVGGCTLDAAEAVCGASLPGLLPVDRRAVLDLLDSLVDKSLLRYVDLAGQSRFWMLETIREYARGRLETSGEPVSVRNAHALYYLELAEQAEPLLLGAEQARWLARLEREHDNLREALSNLLESGDVAAAARLASALRRFWYLHGHITEGRHWLEETLLRRADLPLDLRARTLHAAGTLAWSQGDYPDSSALFSQSLEISRQLGDTRGIASMLNNLGTVALPQGDLDTAHDLHAEALALFRLLGDDWGVSMSLANLGLIATNRRDWAAAEALLDESLRIRRELGDKQSIAQSLNNLGTVMRYKGDYALAHRLHDESLAIFKELDDRWSIALCYANLGAVLLAQGIYADARGLFRDALMIFNDLGVRQGVATCLEGLAAAQGRTGRAELAAALFGVAEALREAIGVPLSGADEGDYRGHLRAARSALSPEVFDRARAKGRVLSLDEAVRLSLSDGL